MLQLSDESLVDEIRSGSTLAFGLLMKRYERLVYRIAMNYTRSPDSAMDITQNVFLKAHRKLNTYSGKGSVKGWLMRIARNESASWLRKYRHDQMGEELTEMNEPVLAAVQEDDLALDELRTILTDALERLKPRETLALSLRYFEEFSLREIAYVLDTSEGTVKSILFRAIEKLRQFSTFKRSQDYAQL